MVMRNNRNNYVTFNTKWHEVASNYKIIFVTIKNDDLTGVQLLQTLE